MKKFYKCVIGIDKYKSGITGPDLIVGSDMITLINELGEHHRMPSDIFSTHFKPLISNKRKRKWM